MCICATSSGWNEWLGGGHTEGPAVMAQMLPLFLPHFAQKGGTDAAHFHVFSSCRWLPCTSHQLHRDGILIHKTVSQAAPSPKPQSIKIFFTTLVRASRGLQSSQLPTTHSLPSKAAWIMEAVYGACCTHPLTPPCHRAPCSP